MKVMLINYEVLKHVFGLELTNNFVNTMPILAFAFTEFFYQHKNTLECLVLFVFEIAKNGVLFCFLQTAKKHDLFIGINDFFYLSI